MSYHTTIQEQTEAKGVLERVDFYRLDAARLLDPERRSQMGQFMTPEPVARFMASLFGDTITPNIRLLDAGAGVGSLCAAFVDEFVKRVHKPANIHITAYELDSLLAEYLNTTLSECRHSSEHVGIGFDSEALNKDFIRAGVDLLSNDLFDPGEKKVAFTHAILNPPYRKIRTDSEDRMLLRIIGVETTNLYAGFLAVAIKLLTPGGELVAITPRSFCNGPYFKPYRKLLLENTALRYIHVFESRNQAFKEDDVLQENIIFHAIKGNNTGRVTVSSSNGPDIDGMTIREVDYSQIVKSKDPDLFIHIATNELDQHVVDRISCFEYTLDDIGIDVSTGRVVDFRAKDYLRNESEQGTVPLIYPTHFDKGFIKWPKSGTKKPNAIVINSSTEGLMLPQGYYVVVKRFSPKEEHHRIVPAIYDPTQIKAPHIGFENHLNVYHCKNAGLSLELAKGLAVFLQSSLLDIFFRQFNGHTQVNATDLRMLRYPSRKVLEAIGSTVGNTLPSQKEIDKLIEKEVHKMANIETPDPVNAKRKIDEALNILKSLGLPKAQQNERSALTLLALLYLKPGDKWCEVSSHLIGITPIMEFCRENYGRAYAPNTRETFRRQTMHQFVAAGLAVENPDKPDRPINSPKWCYQVEPSFLSVIKTYGTPSWKKELKNHLGRVETLKDQYARRRKMKMIPAAIANGKEIQLTPGKHNELIKSIIEEFTPRFAPGGEVLYVGDTGQKWAYFDETALEKLGINVGSRGKMPDVAIYYPKKDWILLIEAVTSHGPVDSKRRDELSDLFKNVRGQLVYITAFPTRAEMTRYLNEISWETEVWVAEAPTHLIHFNGMRFLGPYDS